MKRKVIRGAMALFILLAMVITQSISVSAPPLQNLSRA